MASGMDAGQRDSLEISPGKAGTHRGNGGAAAGGVAGLGCRKPRFRLGSDLLAPHSICLPVCWEWIRPRFMMKLRGE